MGLSSVNQVGDDLKKWKSHGRMTRGKDFAMMIIPLNERVFLLREEEIPLCPKFLVVRARRTHAVHNQGFLWHGQQQQSGRSKQWGREEKKELWMDGWVRRRRRRIILLLYLILLDSFLLKRAPCVRLCRATVSHTFSHRPPYPYGGGRHLLSIREEEEEEIVCHRPNKRSWRENTGGE